jgi:signal transduction histidine kinase
MVDDAITQARQLARGLQPVTLEASGLASALRGLAEKVEEVYHISCVFDCERIVPVRDNVIAMHLYRIAQEAVNNAIKHGKARMIILELAEESGHVRLTVRDNGVGMEAGVRDSKGMGLHSMAYRAAMIGGTFDIRPGLRGGTIANCIVPISGANKGIDHGSQAQQETAESPESRKAATASSGNGNPASGPGGKKKARARRR